MICTTRATLFPIQHRHRRREWHCRCIPRLDPADLAQVAEILGRHAAESRIEEWERQRAGAAGHDWTALRLEIDGRRQGAPGSAVVPWSPHEVRISTWGHTAAFVVRPEDVSVTIDDEPRLAKRTLTAIRRTLRPRRRRALALVASPGSVQALALILPVMLGALALDVRMLTLLVLAGVGAPLAAWLWWYHQVWLFRAFVDLPAGWRLHTPTTMWEVAA